MALSALAVLSLPLLASACHPGYEHSYPRRDGRTFAVRGSEVYARQNPVQPVVAPAQITPAMPVNSLPFPTPTAGAQPSLAAAPTLPAYTFTTGAYPAQDAVPPTDSAEVRGWVAAIDWSKVPTYAPNTGPNLCTSNPTALADAQNRKWWTCGQWTDNVIDIVNCPEQHTWGTSFDDGPSASTEVLIEYLERNKIKSTFYVIGSRALGQPDMLRREHILGHELAGHTWSHPQLTTLTNEQIVAELGWTRKLIKDMTGVTTLTFRPPQGDIDSRVREIARQMNLQPVMWSAVTGNKDLLFDTQDFSVNAGQVTAAKAVSDWKSFLDTNLPAMNTGFITLEHDLYPTTVALAVGYFLPDALNRTNPALALKTVMECQGKALGESYVETARLGGILGTSTNSTNPSTGGSSAPVAGASSTRAGASASASGSAVSRSASAVASARASASVTGTSGAERQVGLIGSSVVVAGGLAAFVSAFML